MSENLIFFENLKAKMPKFRLVVNSLTSCTGSLDHLAIGLVDNKYRKLGKIGEKYFGMAHINLPLW